MFLNIHPLAKIGYKKLTAAEINNTTGNQTHIGLFSKTLNFIENFEQQSFAQFIYNNQKKDLLSFLGVIHNPDGSFRSPKIRSGSVAELNIGGTEVNSVVREIKSICSTDTDKEWVLMWFGLENEDLVFILLESDSDDFQALESAIGPLKKREILDPFRLESQRLMSFIVSKVNHLNTPFFEALEVSAQTNEPLKTFKKPKPFDLKKAKERFQQIGIKGEELVNQHLQHQKKLGLIKGFTWVNENSESGLPYDFSIEELNGEVAYMDVKTTAFKFTQPIILSQQELTFASDNPNYIIYRVFDVDSVPKVSNCENVSVIAHSFLKIYNEFVSTVNKQNISISSLKVKVFPNDKRLKKTASYEL